MSGLLTHRNSETVNVCCFKPPNLQCSKRKLVHNLVNTIYFPRSFPTLEHASKLLLRTSSAQNNGIGALIFSLVGSLQTYSPKSYWGFFPSPISGQTPTHPSKLDSRITFPVTFVLKSSDRIKTVFSVVSETFEETSIIIFIRFGCTFLFSCLLNSRGQVNSKTGYKDRGKHPSRCNRDRTGTRIQF